MSEWERHSRILEQTRKDVEQLKREVSIQRIKVRMNEYIYGFRQQWVTLLN